MARLFKLDVLLKGEDRSRAIKIALDPGKTADELHAHVRRLGFFVARTSVYNWRERQRRLATAPTEKIVRLIRLQAEARDGHAHH